MITAEELEHLYELKEKGVLTDEEFNRKREEYLSSNNISIVKQTKSVTKVLLIAILFIVALSSIKYFTSNKNIGQNINNRLGEKGFSAKLECCFGLMDGSCTEVPFAGCTMYSTIDVYSGNSRQSYYKYQIPDTLYLPQHFQMSIDNASDKFTLVMKVIDAKTQNVVAVREVGPNSYDMIQN